MTHEYIYSRIKTISYKTLMMGLALLIMGAVGTFTISAAWAQSYDLLLKGGHVIDPKNHVDAVRDVAVKDGKIALVATNIPASEAKKVVDVSGDYVTPGIIDIHTHDFWGYVPQDNYGGGYDGIKPDELTFRSGVTTVVDAGSSGWRTFPIFKKRVIDHARVRVLAFLNIVGHGMRGNPTQQDTLDMSARLTAMRMRQYPNIIVGIKLAHFQGHTWMPVKTAEKASVLGGNKPIMVDFGSATPVLPLDSLFFDVMKPGDIYTHCFSYLQRGNPLRGRESLVTKDYKLRPFVKKAQKKGIIFDIGHGGGSFSFHVAMVAMKDGVMPNSISSDMHKGDINAGMKDMRNLMSKFLNLPGETLQKVIKQSTWNPAQEIQHEELGNLSKGAPADIAVFSLNHGKFGFVDAYGGRMMGNKKLICELTVHNGNIVWDLNGISHLPYLKVEQPRGR